MASGDFNGDHIDDLAIPIPNEDVGTAIDAGSVEILYGASAGLTATGSQVWNKNKSGIAGDATNFEQFGTTLATGDFNGDGFADLAVGVPKTTVSGLTNAGAVHIIYGSAKGLRGSGSQFWTQDSAGVLDGFAQRASTLNFVEARPANMTRHAEQSRAR